jgi:hypothetical protein
MISNAVQPNSTMDEKEGEVTPSKLDNSPLFLAPIVYLSFFSAIKKEVGR